MSDLQGLHSQAKRLILSLRTGLERLESAESTGVSSAEMSGDMRQKLADLLKTSQQLDTQYRMQVLNETGSKKGIWKRKVDQVAEETDFLRVSLEKFAGREARRNQEAAARDELMRRSVSGALGGGEIEPAPAGDEAAIAGSINNSKQALEDAFSQGAAILMEMTQQRERLKATKRKVLDVLSSIGLSDSLLRMIDRRQRLDAIIVYGGMLLIVLVLLLLWWFFK